MVAYADESHVYALAMRAAAFVPSPRLLAAVNVGASTFTLGGHGLADGDELRFSLEGDAILGGPATSLPGPLSASSLYYAIAVGSDMFQVSTTPGGSALALTLAGVGPLAVVLSPVPVIRRLCRHWSANVDAAAVAHKPPFVVDDDGEYPDEIVGVVARCAGRDAVRVLGLNNPDYAADRQELFSMRTYDEKLLDAWRGGRLIRGARDQTPSAPEAGARAWSSSERRDDSALGGDFA